MSVHYIIASSGFCCLIIMSTIFLFVHVLALQFVIRRYVDGEYVESRLCDHSESAGFNLTMPLICLPIALPCVPCRQLDEWHPLLETFCACRPEAFIGSSIQPVWWNCPTYKYTGYTPHTRASNISLNCCIHIKIPSIGSETCFYHSVS